MALLRVDRMDCQWVIDKNSGNALFPILRQLLQNKPYSYNNVDWREVYDLSCRLGVCAVAYDGFLLAEKTNIDEDLYYKWIGQSVVKECAFTLHSQVLSEIAKVCADNGISTFVLKGLSFGTNYPNPSHRPCGDIDIYCVKNSGQSAFQEGNEAISTIGAEVNTGWYKHSKIHYKKVTIENHDYLVTTRLGKRYKELNQKLVGLLLTDKHERLLYDTGALIPSSYFNALFQAYHSCSHFLAEGIGLRHVLDWATFLQKEQTNIDWNEFYADCEQFHLKRFIVAMTDIAVHKLGITIINPKIETDSPYADRLLNSILYDDAKVFGSTGGAWNHRFKLVKNAVKYRWKYKEIAQESYLKHIFFSIWGFIFHTED